MPKCNLTERVVFQTLSEEESKNGFDKEIWIDYYRCWSGFKVISGKEYLDAKALQSENVATFTVRYCKKTLNAMNDTKKYRVVHKNKVYDIKHAYDVKNERCFIDFISECTS